MGRRLRSAVSELVFAAYLLAFTEWLFQITKPSFMSLLSFREALQVLLVSPLYLLVPLLPLQAVVATLRFVWPSAVIPAAVHAATALLLVDNFAYTVFGLGIVNLAGSTRYLFASLWLMIAGLIAWRRARSMRFFGPFRFRPAVVLVIAAVAIAGVRVTGTEAPGAIGPVSPSARKRPDILFISLDGMEATHTSFLGYSRATTPSLDRLADTSLVFENAFSNNCYTTGALLSLLSGKRPTDFRLFYPPTTLWGAHAYQHLPGLLRRLGYRTAQFTPRYWATAPWQGMRDAFDYVNGVDVRNEELFLPTIVNDRLPAEHYFLMQTQARIVERGRHLLGIATMQQPMDVARNHVADMGDTARIDGALRFLAKDPQQPAFVQVHLMRGHCCSYLIPRLLRKFSLTADGVPAPLMDLYDDAIRLMDADVGNVIATLERYDRLDDVLIVVTSDHGMHWRSAARVPLLIRFPGGRPRGRVSVNAQLADVAPTVLDDLGLPAPAWMTGQSLLDPTRLDPLRPIISASQVEKSPFHIPKPPLLGLRALSAIVCGRQYELDLASGDLVTQSVDGHTAPCPASDEPPAGTMKALLTEHLAARGFVAPAP